MTRHLRSSDTDPRHISRTGRPDRPDQHTEDETPEEISWDGANPQGEPFAGLDAEIGAAARSLFFALISFVPARLLPFGAKARDRRERRREVDTIAATRRTQLAELLAARRNSHVDKADGATHRGHPRTVAALLTALVIGVRRRRLVDVPDNHQARHLRTRPTPARRQPVCRPTNQTDYPGHRGRIHTTTGSGGRPGDA
jgi:hypothetical protein